MDSMSETNIEIHSAMPKPFPPEYASDWGEDRHGLWMSFKCKNIRQVLRWIRPGKFMMGSPENEPERYDDERLHEVILTHGFWMAETACVQELWEAVMGSNLSHFKGAKRPVDSVSWDDCMEFIEKINSMIPGLDLRLPTEAEWEYSCRAGTTTPFSFGENITTDQVNYDGNNPYNDGAKGEYRKKTVDVKSFPCNNWGLYEMHGNVWEWCSDWFAKYPEGSLVDPGGPDIGVYRVLRGGSWIYYGRDVRSAFRYRYEPGSRDDDRGFRFAQGHKSQGS